MNSTLKQMHKNSTLLFFTILSAFHMLFGLQLNAADSSSSSAKFGSGAIPPPPSMIPKYTPGKVPAFKPAARNSQSTNRSQSTKRRSRAEAKKEAMNSTRYASPSVDLSAQIQPLELVDNGTTAILELFSDLLDKPILRQQNLPSVKISFASKEDMTVGDAIVAIESLLALNGIAIMPVGDKFLKAVPASSATKQVPDLFEGSTLGQAATQRIYAKLFEFRYLSTDEALAMVSPLLTQGNPLPYTRSNMIMITDSLINLQRVEKLLLKLDRPADTNQKLYFYELKNVEAELMAERMQKMKDGPMKILIGEHTTVEADERTNQLFVLARPDKKKVIDEFIAGFDVDIDPLTSTRMYNIRHAEALEVSDLIEQIVTGQKKIRDDSTKTGTAQSRTVTRNRNRGMKSEKALQFSDYVSIVADERANTILATGTTNDHRFLKTLIDQIDVVLAQVRIEVVITEVTLGDADETGMSSLGFTYNTTGEYDTTPAAGDGGRDPINIDGIDFLGIGAGLSIGESGGFAMDAVIDAVKGRSNANILSAPTIVTTHNREASISVGQEFPIVTGETDYDSDGTGITTTVDYKDVDLSLTVKPLIGSNGIVQLEIHQEDTSLGTTTDVSASLENQPTFNSRTTDSYVSVASGQMVVLSGLQSLNTTYTESKFPLLHYLPLVGDSLFTKKVNTEERKELLIFLRPTIVRTPEEANMDAEQQLDKIASSDEVRKYLETGNFRLTYEKEEAAEEEEQAAKKAAKEAAKKANKPALKKRKN